MSILQKLPRSLYHADQVRALDQLAIEEARIAGICLMERAGKAAFDLLKQQWPQAHRLIILCGVGNNGGDGYVLARLAYLAGCDVTVLQLGEVAKLKGEAQLAFTAMTQVGLSPQTFAPALLTTADVIVDALLGTGLDRAVTGAWRTAIEALHQQACGPILSIDIPSGLHADTGAVLGVAVRADLTLSFIGLKLGLLTGQGPEHCGALYFDDLGVPTSIYENIAVAATRLDDTLLKQQLTRRQRTAHKGQYGHVLIIGGEQGLIGAVCLAAMAAGRVGAGKVSIATRAVHAALIAVTHPEIMSHGVESVADLAVLLEKVDVVAIGPGLGQSAWGQQMWAAIKAITKPLVIDADALNLLAQVPTLLPPHSVATPHPGEASRLLDLSTAAVQTDRLTAIRTLQHHFGGIWVLKGAGTVIADATGSISLCHAGNPGMACGGMGDILTGVIAGLLAQRLPLLQAAQVGVYLHALAGDHAAMQGERGLLPRDLLPWLYYYANPT